MRILRALALRLHGLFGSRDGEADFTAELESHIAHDIDAGVRSGLSEKEARRVAMIRLGGVEQTRQAQRERSTLPLLESFLRDASYALRTLARNRGTTFIAILSIALGIGANSTIFSMVSRFVLRPAPVGDPTMLLALHLQHDGDRCCNHFSYPLYLDAKAQKQLFSDVAAYEEMIPASIGGDAEPERVWGQGVTANFFNVTQVPIILGRGFIDGKERAAEVVIGAGLWRRHFNADPTVLGKPVTISGHVFTIVGIATPKFHSIDQILYTEFWVPLGSTSDIVANSPSMTNRDYYWLQPVARLQPGVTREQALAGLETLASRLAASYPATDKGNHFVFEQAGSLPPRERKPVMLFLTALFIVVLMVLAIAGVNVANLLFAQAAGRQRDMAVRIALGATRARLQRQILLESVILGLGGGVLGLAVSFWSTSLLSSVRFPAPIPLDLTIAVDFRVMLFTFTLSIVSGILLGVAPAWAASRPQLANALKGEDALQRPGRRISLRNLLLVVQVAMSVVLLCVTGLFLRSLQSATSIDIGFRFDHLLMMSVDPRVENYPTQRTVEFLNELERRAKGLPGVVSAVITDSAPLSGGNRSDGFSVVGKSEKDNDAPIAELYMTTPGYFKTLGIPIIAGHDFETESSNGPRTALVNQTFVARVFHGENPIGQRVSGAGVIYQIIGVVGDVKSRTLGEDYRPVLYRSLQQTIPTEPSGNGYTLVVESAASTATVAQALRGLVHTLDPSMAIYHEETMQEHVRAAFLLPRMAAMLFGVFGFIGLVLAGVGLYGVMSYAVSRRTREIGIRMALGAKRGTVERLVLRQGAVITLVAIALGWPAAWMLARLATSFLYGIQPHDAFTFGIVPPFLFLIAIAACYIPARRAAAVDPMRALRTE